MSYPDPRLCPKNLVKDWSIPTESLVIHGMERMCFEWKPRFVPSWLALREDGLKVTVVRIDPRKPLGKYPNLHRIYDAYIDGVRVYDATTEFRLSK